MNLRNDLLKKEIKEIIDNGTESKLIWGILELQEAKHFDMLNQDENKIVQSLQEKLIKKVSVEKLIALYKDMRSKRDSKFEIYTMTLDLQACIAERIIELKGKEFKF